MLVAAVGDGESVASESGAGGWGGAGGKGGAGDGADPAGLELAGSPEETLEEALEEATELLATAARDAPRGTR